MKVKFVSLAVASLLGAILFAASAAGQAAAPTADTSKDDALKALKKALQKNSRQQFQTITKEFKPLEFKTCKIRYTYERVGSIGNENFGNATVASGQAASADTDSIKSPNMRTGAAMNTNRTTTYDLADIDVNTVSHKKLAEGVFVGFATVDKKAVIERDADGGGSKTDYATTEYLPVSSEKKAEEVVAAFIAAIKACQPAQ